MNEADYYLAVGLINANLTGASLTRAKLNYAKLAHANLTDADLTVTRLHGADLDRTVFSNVDLSQVQGLESTKHKGPSSISTNTLKRSRGQIPRAFLKGCGLSDWEIEAAKLWNPDLNEDERTTIWYEIERIRGQQPWALSRVFVSYTRIDEPFIEAIEKRFDEKGVRYWRDVHDLKAGRLERQIDRAITLNPLVLLVLSERSVLSDWVEWEAKKARKVEQQYRREGTSRDVLCPVALDDAWKTCDWPGTLRDQIEKYNILDFSDWTNSEVMERQFAKLYEGLILHY